jgi:hypothetical protein
MCRVQPTNRRRITDRNALLYGLNANQIAMATMAATIATHTIGVSRFELPLRGESLAAWLNSLFTGALATLH